MEAVVNALSENGMLSLKGKDWAQLVANLQYLNTKLEQAQNLLYISDENIMVESIDDLNQAIKDLSEVLQQTQTAN